MERNDVKQIIEALLYMTDHALSVKEIAEILETKRWTEAELRDVINEINQGLVAANSSLQVLEVAGGFQMATKPDFASWIRRLYKERLTVRLSSSAMETLSIVAYKQPIARSDIEQIRGVEVTAVMETLLERRLIRVVGRKETIGRPLLYGTTIEFLRHFGLKHLSQLPDINSLAAEAPAPLTPASTQEEELVFAGDHPATDEAAPVQEAPSSSEPN